MLPFAVDLSQVPVPVLLWPLLFGLGAYLVLVSQPIGRPKPDLVERLRRLDVDERIRMDLGRRDARPLFASRVLEALLRPILDDAGRFCALVLGRLGLAGISDLEGRLQVARPGVGTIQFLGEKVATALIGLAIFPLMNAVEVHPFGTWPLWTLVLGGVTGFLAPDWEMERRLAARRLACLMELPTMLDLLTIACSAGLSLEQALGLVARQSEGVVARELQRAVREMALGQRSLAAALDAIAERNAIPELTQFVGRTRAAYDQGAPLVQSLTIQAEALREQKRLRIVEEGGQASVRMILPVALFILPVLFVVLLVPAAVELLHLGG
ncbi:MAG TPA: type II secretion system F family protein [Candidatus Saccharimonadales bacterium]|nr:type II secretion system F family protein [Candidatus Saccharimonadales bacterium]HVC34653.1 type II secretion system F family protein [Chloroflexota bacterium]